MFVFDVLVTKRVIVSNLLKSYIRYFLAETIFIDIFDRKITLDGVLLSSHVYFCTRPPTAFLDPN